MTMCREHISGSMQKMEQIPQILFYVRKSAHSLFAYREEVGGWRGVWWGCEYRYRQKVEGVHGGSFVQHRGGLGVYWTMNFGKVKFCDNIRQLSIITRKQERLDTKIFSL